MITQEIVRELLDYDPETGKLFWRERDRWWFKSDQSCKGWNTRYGRKEAFTTIDEGYHKGAILYKNYKAQRVIWLWMEGEWPEGEIDHINHDKEDNRWINLRLVSHQENSKNQSIPKNNRSGCVGVHFHKRFGKWCAQIRVDKKCIHMGYFDSYEDAVNVRKESEVKHSFHENHGV